MIVNLYLDNDLIDECKRLAKKQNLTLNQFIMNALIDFINTQEAKNVGQI